MKRLLSLGLLGLLLSWAGLLLPTPPEPADPAVAALGRRFEDLVGELPTLRVSCKGHMLRDRDTFFWSLFTDHFGSNPNTPYMWLALPAFGYFLPSPMWHMKRQDAVVLIARRPPSVEYFSFTSFALWVPRKGLQFSSLADSVNHLTLKQTEEGLFAHVLTASQETNRQVEQALVASGLPKSAINLRVVPSDVGDLFDDWTHFETVLRLFRFENQTEGDAYLHSNHPVYYLKGSHESPLLATQNYRERRHELNRHERDHEADFQVYQEKLLKAAGEALEMELNLRPKTLAPLMIQGLECLKSGTQCLGDCPDAAYYGPNVLEDSDSIEMLSLDEDELHLVALANHRLLNVSVYGSLALLRSPKPTLSKTRMNIRATDLGVTSFDFPEEPFISWAFSRSAEHCSQLGSAVHGCSVVEQVRPDHFLTYCERIYLNPTTGTGPHWEDLLPARLYEVKVVRAQREMRGLPAAIPVRVYDGTVPMHFTHLVKTGGESLELHSSASGLALRYAACRGAAAAAAGAGAGSCSLAARGVSAVLCAMNCECCAKDVLRSGGFQGSILRSPRAHAMSIFSQCHVAHQNDWARIFEDVPQYLAEGILRGTERLCGNYCTAFQADWQADLEKMIAQNASGIKVIPFLHNMQAHALTCSNQQGSLGQHFRLPEEPLAPSFADANATLHSFHWIGLTELFEHSVCLLHYQANGSLPAACDCRQPFLRLPRFTHGVPRRTQRLPQELLHRIDEFTSVDAQLFAVALRLLLGRLRYVEDATKVPLLSCVRWKRLWQHTRYIPKLWVSPNELAS